MEFRDKIIAIQASLNEGETFVDFTQTEVGYLLTVGDDDYYHNIALTPQQFEQLSDAIAEIMVPGITEMLKGK